MDNDNGHGLDNVERRELFDKLAKAAVGLDITYELATGERSRRIYLDSTASSVAFLSAR